MADSMVKMLIRGLSDPDSGVRRSSIWALHDLGDIGLGDTEEIQALIRALRDPDSGVRECSARTLGDIGPAAKEVVLPALTEALGDTDSRVRRSSIWALRALLAVPEVVPVLIRTLRDRDYRVRRTTAWALLDIGPGAKEAIPALIEAQSHDGHQNVREAAALALRVIRRDE